MLSRRGQARVIAAALVILTSCGVQARLAPARLQLAFLYGRVTDCPKATVPSPLPPASRLFPVTTPNTPPDDRCDTTEVGAKSYADAISAIGAALVAFLPFL